MGEFDWFPFIDGYVDLTMAWVNDHCRSWSRQVVLIRWLHKSETRASTDSSYPLAQDGTTPDLLSPTPWSNQTVTSASTRPNRNLLRATSGPRIHGWKQPIRSWCALSTKPRLRSESRPSRWVVPERTWCTSRWWRETCRFLWIGGWSRKCIRLSKLIVQPRRERERNNILDKWINLYRTQHRIHHRECCLIDRVSCTEIWIFVPCHLRNS